MRKLASLTATYREEGAKLMNYQKTKTNAE